MSARTAYILLLRQSFIVALMALPAMGAHAYELLLIVLMGLVTLVVLALHNRREHQRQPQKRLSLWAAGTIALLELNVIIFTVCIPLIYEPLMGNGFGYHGGDNALVLLALAWGGSGIWVLIRALREMNATLPTHPRPKPASATSLPVLLMRLGGFGTCLVVAALALRDAHWLVLAAALFGLFTSGLALSGRSLPAIVPHPRLFIAGGVFYFLVKTGLHLFIWEQAFDLSGANSQQKAALLAALLLAAAPVAGTVTWLGARALDAQPDLNLAVSRIDSRGFPLLLIIPGIATCLYTGSNPWLMFTLVLLAIFPGFLLLYFTNPIATVLPASSDFGNELRETLDALDNANVAAASASLALLLLMRDTPRSTPRFCAYVVGPGLFLAIVALFAPLTSLIPIDDSVLLLTHITLVTIAAVLALFWTRLRKPLVPFQTPAGKIRLEKNPESAGAQ